jgi:catechol 2,3-dioxygenase
VDAAASSAGRTAPNPLPSTLRLGAAHLVVTDLTRSVGFYERSLGLRLHWQDGNRAGLGGAFDDALVLVEEPRARPAGRHAGLYHVALLHPSRLELARAARRLALTRTPIYGASDHGVSEAIYLPDPDGNELELAADRLRQEWPDLRSIGGGPRPLDLPALLALVAGEEPVLHVDEDIRVGHVHLHVGDIEQGLAFYAQGLGFEVQMRMPSAAFVSANGYHHQLGFNTWRGEGVPPAPAQTVGLKHWTVILEDRTELDAVLASARAAGIGGEERSDGVLLRDPWSIGLLLATAPYPRPRSLARVETPFSSEYVSKVGERLRHLHGVSFDARAATIRFAEGRAEVHAEPDRLVLEAIARSAGDLPQLEERIGSELQAVAGPEVTAIDWRRPARPERRATIRSRS